MNPHIQMEKDWQEQFLIHHKNDGPWSPWSLYQLSNEVQERLAIPSFEGLLAPKFLPDFTPLPHQLEVAQKVVEKMNGKAILADEVGLGKTVEAGLIMKEYMIRGLAKKILILVPASLVSQWVKELREKFLIPAVEQKKSYVWEQCDVVVSSIDTAKRSPHKEIVLSLSYDLVIIDEAHKLKNNKTKNYEFARTLKKKYCLLLTATPIQNKIEEIFNLVSLLKPGHLGNETVFSEAYSKQKLSIQEQDHLKNLVNKVMIRNRRQNTGVDWTKRLVKTVPVTLSPSEEALYKEITDLRRNKEEVSSAFSIMTLERECCSSREAVYLTLKKMIDNQEKEAPALHMDAIDRLMTQIHQVTQNSKAIEVVDLIKKINDKVVIFTEYRASQIYLQWFLQQNGISSVPFRGGFKRGKKDWMKELFRNKVQVLIATEAGGEGINLQFCNSIINYDLPWNPMRLEQRIGRIHRFGQTRDVQIYNMATKNTIEEHILKLLYEKIHLFEKVVGELDDILARLDSNSFEEDLHNILYTSKSDEEMQLRINQLQATISNQA